MEEAIVNTVINLAGHWGSVVTISRRSRLPESKVLQFCKSRPHIFKVVQPKKAPAEIILKPNLKLCQHHSQNNNCKAANCKDLHFCYFHLRDNCSFNNKCKLEHDILSIHNIRVLKYFSIVHLEKEVIIDLLKCSVGSVVKPTSCFFYNKGNCKFSDKCSNLHICYYYLRGSCTNNECSYNHNILDPQCIEILNKYQIDTTRDDLLEFLKKKPSVNRTSSSTDRKMTNSFNDENKDLSNNKSERNIKGSRKATTNNSSSSKVHEHYLKGNVQKDEICIDYLNEKCKQESCDLMHSRHPFCWQFQHYEDWYNFRMFQSQKIETAYKNPDVNMEDVPMLNPADNHHSVKVLKDILGNNKWRIDFHTMMMQTKDFMHFMKVRRLSTKSSGEEYVNHATINAWYFKDIRNSWIKYGLADSLGESNLISSVNSHDIEKAYLAKDKGIYFKNKRFTYFIDFDIMMQQNKDTKTTRSVCRRPETTVQDADSRSENKNSFSQDEYPSNWTQNIFNDFDLLFDLDLSSSESKCVINECRLTYPHIRIEQIERIQNKHLWKKFKNKQEELKSKAVIVNFNTQHLFHSIKAESLSFVCNNNLDSRIDPSSNQQYGRGTCFSNSVALTVKDIDSYTTTKLMIMFRVIIGDVTVGSMGMTRPPNNPTTGRLFNTTVDKENDPSYFVKYDKLEYYPEYVIRFT